MDRTHIVVMNEAHRMNSDQTPVKVTLYRWAGSWGPFKVNIPCGECSLTVDVIEDTFKTELDGIPVELETHDWLSLIHI